MQKQAKKSIATIFPTVVLYYITIKNQDEWLFLKVAIQWSKVIGHSESYLFKHNQVFFTSFPANPHPCYDY